MAAARESISPLLNNVRSRRLSLELCQKIGAHLLSPSRSNNASGESSLSPSPSPNTSKFLSGSPFARFQNASPSQNRRGSSGCIATSPLVTASLSAFAANNGDGTPAHTRRRSSLTPIYSNTPSPALATSVSDIPSFAVPAISVNSFEDADSEPPCQWNFSTRRRSLNTEGSGAGSAITAAFLSPNRYDTRRSQPSLSCRKDEEHDEMFKFLNSSSAICNANNGMPSKGDTIDCRESTCDLNNNNCNYTVNNENIDPTHLRPSSSCGFFCIDHHHQANERRKSFPPVSYDKSHKTHNKNQLDKTLVTLVSQQCSDLVLNPHEILGKGSFGTVVAAVHRGKPAAVKVIHTTTPSNRISLNGERNALRLQPHPSIARIYEIIQFGPQNQALIVMEQMRTGNLLTALNDSSIYFNGSFCIQLAAEIASALFYCHLNGILHLDVKPSNILIDFQNHCKLSDFGNSKTIQDLMSSTSFAKLDGTVAYIAPECFRGVIPTDKCDVYSFGITMWQILSRETPYQGETEHSIIYKVVAQGMRPKLTPQFHLAKFQSQEAFRKYMQVYEMCWQQYPDARPNMKTVSEFLLSLQAS